MATERLGVGLIGLGNSGWHYHAEGSLAHSKDFELVAVCSRDPERRAAAARRFGAVAHADWRSLVDDDRVGVVVIATPHHLHAPLAIGALRAGRHVVVEKPMAMTVAEAQAMIEASQEGERLLTVFHNRRWEPSFTLIRDLVESGTIGNVWRIEERRMHAGRYVVAGVDRPHAGTESAAWAHVPGSGGGVTYLIAPHLIDHQIVLHGAPPVSVSALMHTFEADEVEHYLDLRMEFGAGRMSRIEIFRENAVDLPKWSVFGERGTIIAEDFTSVRWELSDGESRTYDGLRPLQACDEFYHALARSLRDGAPVPVDAREAAQTVAVLEAAHASARQGGRTVSLPV